MPRPKLHPSEEQRRLVKSLTAMGHTHEQIALLLEIRSPKTVRKHFRRELDRGALEANHNVAQTLYRMATSGQCVAATIFWAKTRLGMRERNFPETPHSQPKGDFLVVVDRGRERLPSAENFPPQGPGPVEETRRDPSSQDRLERAA